MNDLVENKSQLEECLKTFFTASDTAKLLEINTNSTINSQIFKQFKNHISFKSQGNSGVQ